MKFRRKPVDRDVIDAVKLTLSYVFVNAAGDEQSVPHAEFEALYEPIVRKRDRVAKPKRGRPRKPALRLGEAPVRPEAPPDEFDRQAVPAGMMPI